MDASVVKPRRKMLVSVESSTLAFDCSDEEFRTIEASLYQVLHRTTANQPLRVAQHTRGQKGFEAWHAIARKYVRSEERVREKFSKCSTDQQHL